jgi:hypothetical protein
MSKIMINVRALQAVRNGLLRFDTETKNFEVLNENGEWVESNAGITNIDNAENVEYADSVASASNVTNASSVTTASTVSQAETVNTYNISAYEINGAEKFIVLNQREYDALNPKDENTFYMIEG